MSGGDQADGSRKRLWSGCEVDKSKTIDDESDWIGESEI